MSTTNEQMRFDVDGEPLALALKRVSSQLKVIEKEYVSLGKQSGMTSQKMEAEMTRIIGLYVKEEKQFDKLIQQKKMMAAASQTANQVMAAGAVSTAGALGKTNMMIAQATFAMDDFLTVSQLQNYSTEGMVAGLRAAANNFSVLLMNIHPLLGVVPSLATGIGGPLIKALSGAGGKAEDLADKTARVNELFDELQKKAKTLQFGDQMVQNMEEDAKLNAAIQEQAKIQAKADQAARDFKPTFKKMQPWFGEWEKSIFEEDQRKLIVLQDTAKKELDNLEAMKAKRTEHQQARTAEQKFEPFQGMLGDLASKLAKTIDPSTGKPLKEGQISAALMESGVALRDGTMPEQKIFDRVAHEAWIKQATGEPDKREKIETPVQKKIRLNSDAISVLSIERTEAELAAGPKGLKKEDRKRFEQEEKRLDLEGKKLERQLKLEEDNNKKMDKQIEQQNELIDLQKKMLNMFDSAFNKRPTPNGNGPNAWGIA